MIDALAMGLAADTTVPDDLWVLPDDEPEAIPALREATRSSLAASERSARVRDLAAQNLLAGLAALLQT